MALNYGNGSPATIPVSCTIPAHRLFRVTGVTGGEPELKRTGKQWTIAVGLCGDGEAADGVSWFGVTNGHLGWFNPPFGFLATPGLPVEVEAGAPFEIGTLLQSDASGRAVPHTTGVPLLRALIPALDAGNVVVAVFLGGRC